MTLFSTAKKKKPKKKAEKKELPPNFVTVYTDASASTDGHHSYSFWARAEWDKMNLSKMCPPEISGINQAEMYAICQGIHFVLKHWNIKYGVKGFYIRSDSQHALNRLGNPYKETNSKGKPIPETELRLKRAFDKMVADYSLTIDMKHVRAHTGRKNVKAYLNDWCDKQSRKAIKQHRKSIAKDNSTKSF